MTPGFATGVRLRLLCAVGAVAIMTVVASVVSAFFYARIEERMLAIVGDDMPSLTLALKVAEASSHYAVGAATLSSVRNQFQRQNASIALQQQAHHLGELIAELTKTSIAPRTIDEVARPAGRLQDLLIQLNLLVERSLALESKGREDERALKRADTEFEALCDGVLTGVSGAEADRLRQIETAGLRLVGLIREGRQVEQVKRLAAVREAFAAEYRRLAQLLDGLPASGDFAQVVPRAQAIMELGGGPQPIFDTRQGYLQTTDQIDGLIQQIVDQRTQLSLAVARLVAAVEAKSTASSAAATAALALGQLTLVVIALLTFCGPVLFVWLLIGRTIVTPLTHLADAARRIAGGALDTPIPPPRRRDEIGAMADAMVVFRDAMTELSVSESRLRSILDASVYPIAITRLSDGAVLYRNDYAAAMLGIGPVSLTSPVFAASFFCHPADRIGMIERLRREGRFSNLATLYKRADGTPFWALVSAATMTYQGEPAILASINDISELKRTEAALRVAKDEAERMLAELTRAQGLLVQTEKLAALGGLVAGVAHEVNTPIGVSLTAISQLAGEVGKLKSAVDHGRIRKSDLTQFLADADETLELSLGSVRRAAELVASFKQLAMDQTKEQRRRFDLLDYIHDVEVSVSATARNRGHRIRIECRPGIEVDSYPGAIAEVLTNLVMNSLDHAFAEDQAGTIAIRVDQAGAETVELVYEDDGRGIPVELRDKVFEPFFTTRRGRGNTGLGLYRVFNLITHKLKGRIELGARAGGGTRFALSFPRILPADG